jgi:hypothetical protein
VKWEVDDEALCIMEAYPTHFSQIHDLFAVDDTLGAAIKLAVSQCLRTALENRIEGME